MSAHVSIDAHGKMNLPWNQAERYWLCVSLPAGGYPPLENMMQQAGMQQREGIYILETERAWVPGWERIYAMLKETGTTDVVSISIVGADTPPNMALVRSLAVSPAKVKEIAAYLWLGDALMQEKVLCYFQPVVSSQERIYGYESFARMEGPKGDLLSGAAIIDAAKHLGIEYTLDRYLQIKAIKTFASSGHEGFLFVNFFPGFIQRPDVYLEGLTQTADDCDLLPKQLVLDFTRSSSGHDLYHLKRVCEYCRNKGYSIALDDADSTARAHWLVQEIQPDYVKLDVGVITAAAAAGVSSPEHAKIKEMVEYCHKYGAVVIAEGVETEASFHMLQAMSVDLFQGYYFSQPVPAIARKLSSKGGGAETPPTP